jgi:hypothetical protein
MLYRSIGPLLFWLPRGLAILVAAFISLFALDVFDLGLGPWETFLALLMHLLPTFGLIIALVIAWRWEAIGAAVFALLALLFASRFGLDGPVVVILIGPAIVIAGLFLADFFYRARRARLA